MMGWYGHDMGWWGYIWMGLGGVLLILLVIGAVVALALFLDRDTQPRPSQGPAAILATRFARGEISETEYRDRLAVLQGP